MSPTILPSRCSNIRSMRVVESCPPGAYVVARDFKYEILIFLYVEYSTPWSAFVIKLPAKLGIPPLVVPNPATPALSMAQSPRVISLEDPSVPTRRIRKGKSV